jgi:uncharacterized ParB-like nuclease family protein
LIPFREQTKTERRSAEHIGTMRLALEAAQGLELEPVLAAEIAGRRFIVDGHHRLKAYQQAKRSTIPARVLPMDRREAVLVSKLVNCAERALEMHPEQRRDAAWQYLAQVARWESNGQPAQLPDGESLRSVSGRFGIGKDTVATMLRKLPEVKLADFLPEALDPGTGFPRWRYMREAGAGWQDMKALMTPGQMTQHVAEKGARKIGAILEGMTPEERRRTLEILANEAKLEAGNADTLAFLADIADPDSDY